MARSKTDLAIWRDSGFRCLWIGTILSALGDSSLFIILAWFVIDVTGSEGALGTALLCMSLPRLVFMLLGGAVADRIERKIILVSSVLARSMILSGFSLFLWLKTDVPPPFLIYGMACMFGIVDAFFWPARSSITPLIVDKKQLAAANSMLEGSQQASMIIGPLFASLLLHLSTYALMFLAVATAFFVSLLFLTRLRPVTNHAAHDSKSPIRRDVIEGIRYVSHIRIILIIFMISTLINLMFSGPLNIGLPSLIKRLGWEGSTYGYLEGAVGAGAIAGAAVVWLAKGLRGRFRLISLFLGLMGIAVAALGMMKSVGFGLTMMFITGMTISLVDLPIITYIQTITAPRMLGRVMSLLSMSSLGLTPVGYVTAAFLLQHGLVTSRGMLLLGGAIMGIFGLATILLPSFRRMEEHPKWQQAGHGGAANAKEKELAQ
ncbi:MFS transporter [Brevibacillus sp. B_LB10_24]|uniref:MFS transporter n=1 Tax=Brevibacillus sp. B_LB10_24 TaxID=3380645 RepID=UPI0038B813D7